MKSYALTVSYLNRHERFSMLPVEAKEEWRFAMEDNVMEGGWILDSPAANYSELQLPGQTRQTILCIKYLLLF